MADANHTELVEKERYRFLYDDQAAELFGEIDFNLKCGTHFQYLHPEQEQQFNFIRHHFDGLKRYYEDFFHVLLSVGGSETESYYYLDFEGGKRGEIPADQRYFLSEECLLVGIFACKVFNIDFHSHETTVKGFTSLIRNEYEEYKSDFFRLLAHTKKQKYIGDDEKELDKAVGKALGEFKKLGWVYFLDQERFRVMPSLERIRLLYADEIMNTQKLMAEVVKVNK
jgi:hypothetical protein